MFLCIDVGNTRTKAAVFNAAGEAIDNIITEDNGIGPIEELLRRSPAQHVIISTSGERQWEISSLGFKGKNIELSNDTPLPIQIVYTTPGTLGRDRIAAACGAKARYPGKKLPGDQCGYLHDNGCNPGYRSLPGRQHSPWSPHAASGHA
ncbi:MAG: type III pantothenate kinase [Saprospiraceae bacterium]|nr:type III pantothenate kinase [Candidatus Opimibacter iunctus]